VTDAEVAQLESEIDRMNAGAGAGLFVLPEAAGSTPSFTFAAPSAAAPSAPRWRWAASRPFRRRPYAIEPVERRAIRVEPVASHATGAPEILWEPNQSSSG